MSVDENSRNPNRNPTTALPPPFQLVSSSTADDHSSRKVKLLCSFDGKILPRPSDGALRHAGGQTRLIAVSRDATLPELYRKMADAYGGPVTIRYQLPDEDLDALISVSCAEDLDNMMEEYDKLSEASGDGSAKLRVFLFPPSEIGSSAAEISSSGITGTDPYDSGQRYIEAINGAGTCGIRRKDSTASATSTQNSDVVGNGSNNDGTSPTADSPSAAATASHDSSRATFVGNAASGMEYQGFPANSAVVGQTKETAQVLNPPHVMPYASQAYIESQQVQYITPHSLAMAGGPRFLNVVAVPQHLYLPSMHIPPLSVPSHVGNLKQVQGTVEPEGNQNGGRILQLVPDQNYRFFQQPFSQLPPLNPSNMQPQSVEQYDLHPLPTLPKGQGFRLEDCQMCQKALPHAHSDSVINEQGNLSGISTSEAHPVLRSHHSVDITRLQAQHREVSVAMMENLMDPKIESIVTPSQFGAYGVNNLSEKILEKEKLVVPHTVNLDLSKSKQPLDLVGLSGDTEASYGAFLNPSRPHHEGKLLLQEQQVLHGEHFDHNKVLHLPVTIGFSSTSHASHGVSLSPPQPFHEDSLQQKMVPPAERFNHSTGFHPSGIMDLTGAAQTSYGVFLSPPQRYHEDSVQQHHHQQQLLQATAPPPFAVKQDVFQKQLVQGSSSMKNREYQAPEPLSNSVQVFSHDHVKPVDGMMEALHDSTFENLRLNEQLKPVVPEVTVSKDMEPGKSSLVGEQNNAMRPQNGANQLLSSNTFANPGIVPEGVSVGPVDPMFSNIGISKDMKPDISSLVGAENNTLRPHNGGNALLLGNAFLSPGILPEVNSLSVINPLLSSMVDNMHLHNCQSANTTHISTSVANNGLFSHNFERNVEPSVPDYVLPGITTCRTNYGYRNVINESHDGEWKDKASVVNPKDLDNDIAALPRGNVPFQFSHSICTPEHMEQLVDTSASDSLFCNQDPWKVIGNVPMCPPRPTILGSSEPVSKDMFIEDPFLNSNGPDIAVLLEEGTLQLPVDSLKKDSCPEPFQATRGADYVQDLHELAEQVVESVLQSPLTSAPASCSLESSSTFPNSTRISEDMVNSNSITVVGDQKLEDMKIKQSDKVHFGVPHAEDIGRLQIIKNSDLEELRELGSGTFGTVFHGKWRGSDVAIKRINDRCFSGKPSEQERMRADFWNEASKLADLHHPNVVAFYGIVLDGPGGSFATVTEYMVNGSLRNAIQSNEKTLDQRKRLLIATDVAFGMEYLHGKNIVHFDLKSDNLLVNLRDPQRPICKVGDLGLSKVKCKTLISGGVRGTLPWMAPELLNGSSSLVSEKVDVFSFGMVMWELLTGQEPYADLHYGAIIGGIVNNTLRPPVPESCDPEWKALMEQCWSAEPSGRPSFTEIANRLRFMEASLSHKAQAPSV